MGAQLYFHSTTREIYSNRIKNYVNVYFDRISPQFLNIEEEADQFLQQLYNEYMSTQCDEDCIIDPSTLAELAQEESFELYTNLKITKYNIRLMFVSTLYQLWEQQVRKFLFDEVSHNYNLNFTNFCTDINKIKAEFLKFHYDITTMNCWSEINELRLLSNVIKHGDGVSAQQLFSINPNLFSRTFNGNLNINVYKTTLNEETLQLDDQILNVYREALVNFWYEFPERLYE